MLWTVRHHWPCLARFAFKCYRHKIRVVVRVPGQITMLLMSREGVVQDNLLTMALYGITLLPLIEHLRAEYPDVLQMWYAGDRSMHTRGFHVANCFQGL